MIFSHVCADLGFRTVQLCMDTLGRRCQDLGGPFTS